MSWDPLQREALRAMGYVLYAVDTGDGAAATPDAPASAAGPGEAQLRALLRAAGRRPDDGAARDLCQGWLRDNGLRDAASRRALWPRLRALRRTPRG